ncbi:MAG: alpha-L-fucosidase [Bacteroidota bacterium]
MRLCATLLSLLFLCSAHAQDPSAPQFADAPGGGTLNPGLHTHPEAMERFQDMRIGLSIHWGPSSHGGKEISWSRGEEIPRATYDAFYQQFNPTAFDADAWVQLAKDGGMRYILLTAKHHDGFSLWPSAVTEYDIASTPFERDIVGELAEATRAQGLVFGSYYSTIDWYHPDYQPYGHGGPGPLFETDDATPDFEPYLDFMRAQLRELIDGYGAEIIQLDGEWEPTWNHERGSALYRYLRQVNNEVIVNSRVDVGRQNRDPETGLWDWRIYAGDFEERERMVDWVPQEHHEGDVFGRGDTPWQAWVTIDQAQWSWNATPRLLTAAEILRDLVKTIGDNGNFLINLGPRPDGSFEPEQVARIREVGQWVKAHEDAIYGTRGGPFAREDAYTSTAKGDVVFLYVLDPTLRILDLEAGTQTLATAALYNGQAVAAQAADGRIQLHIPLDEAGGIRVLRLEMK